MACSRFRRAAEELGDVGQRRRRVSAAVVIRRTLCSTHLAQTVETVEYFVILNHDESGGPRNSKHEAPVDVCREAKPDQGPRASQFVTVHV